MLEETVLQLLKTAGYDTIEKAGSDPTPHDGHSGPEVTGRGGTHYIDAVADFCISAPFSYPQRLFGAKMIRGKWPTIMSYRLYSKAVRIFYNLANERIN